MTVDGAPNSPIFLTFLQQVLCPQLRPGDIVVLVNLRAHHVPGVAQAVADAGASLRYLPPYEHDYNPVEFASSKIKARLRTLAMRTRLRLYRALGSALQTVDPQDARAWFSHDGSDLHWPESRSKILKRTARRFFHLCCTLRYARPQDGSHWL